MVRGREGRIEKSEKLRTVGELKDKKRGTMKKMKSHRTEKKQRKGQIATWVRNRPLE